MFLLVVVLLLVLDEPSYRVEETFFSHGDYLLAGLMVFPVSDKDRFPCIVMIHGDGPVDRDSNHGYDVFFEEFTKAGWCVMSWDKPGIGKSTGDWLNQSMSDRADEALAAIHYLQSRGDVRSLIKLGCLATVRQDGCFRLPLADLKTCPSLYQFQQPLM